MRECESGIRVCSLQNREMKNARVKVIIRSGVPEVVLADGDVDVEIIDIDKDYDDHEALCKREREVLNDKSLHSIDFVTANFEEGS